MSRPRPRPCERCGGNRIEVVRSVGFMARCEPCWEQDVEAFRVGGAAPVAFGETAELAIDAWNRGSGAIGAATGKPGSPREGTP